MTDTHAAEAPAAADRSTVTTDGKSTGKRTSTRRVGGRLRVAMRWKLLAAFAGAFTIVFVFIAIWVVQHSANTALDRLTSELSATATGGAATINARAFDTLVTTVAPVPDPSNPTGLGYPDSLLFRGIAEQLYGIRDIVPAANPYTYFRDEKDGKLYFAVSAGYLLTPPFGVTYKQPVSDVALPETYARMEQGLVQTTDEPAYADDFGSWISTYSPIRDSAGKVVGAIGIDYPTNYIDDVQTSVRNQVLPVLVGSYVTLLLLVLILSTALVRPLRRLTSATHRIAEGEYNLDVRSLVKSRFPDEMYELGESFSVMATKVGAREQSLTNEVRRLRVEIDSSKREQAVEEITGTDFFAGLAARAAEMRARMHEPHPGQGSPSAQPEPESSTAPAKRSDEGNAP